MDQGATGYGGRPRPRRLWRPSYPRKKGTSTATIFGPCLLWPNGWMDEGATWYGSRHRPRPHCIRRGPSSPRKGHSSPPPLFNPCLLWPRSPMVIATAELLSYFLMFLNFQIDLNKIKDIRPAIYFNKQKIIAYHL